MVRKIKYIAYAVISISIGSILPWALLSTGASIPARNDFLVAFAIVIGIVLISPQLLKAFIALTLGLFTLGVQIPLWISIDFLQSLLILITSMLVLVVIQLTKTEQVLSKVERGGIRHLYDREQAS